MENTIGSDEKVIVEKDKMGMVHALLILEELRDMYLECEDVQEAFRTVFEWIGDITILLHKLGL